MEQRKRPAGEIAAIVLSVIAAAALVIGGIAAAVVLVLGTVMNVQTGLGSWASNYAKYTYSNAGSYSQSADFTVEEDVKKLNIEWLAGSITVKASDDGSIHVYESSDSDDPKDVMCYKTDGERLTIKFRASGYYAIDYKKDLTVEIPASLEIKSIVINTVSSELTFDGGSFGDITVSNVSGAVTLSDADCHEIDIDTVSGGVSCAFASQPHDVDIKSISGNVDLTLPYEPEDLNIESVGGKIKVNGAETRFEYESDSRTGSGDVEIDTVSGNVSVETLG